MGRYQLPEEDLSQGMVAEAMRSWGWALDRREVGCI